MPGINYDQLLEKQKNDKGFRQKNAYDAIIRTVNSWRNAARYLEANSQKELAEELKKYQKALSVLQGEPQTERDVVRNAFTEALNQMRTLKDFLSAKDQDGISNYEKISRAVGETGTIAPVRERKYYVDDLKLLNLIGEWEVPVEDLNLEAEAHLDPEQQKLFEQNKMQIENITGDRAAQIAAGVIGSLKQGEDVDHAKNQLRNYENYLSGRMAEKKDTFKEVQKVFVKLSFVLDYMERVKDLSDTPKAKKQYLIHLKNLISDFLQENEKLSAKDASKEISFWNDRKAMYEEKEILEELFKENTIDEILDFNKGLDELPSMPFSFAPGVDAEKIATHLAYEYNHRVPGQNEQNDFEILYTDLKGREEEAVENQDSKSAASYKEMRIIVQSVISRGKELGKLLEKDPVDPDAVKEKLEGAKKSIDNFVRLTHTYSQQYPSLKDELDTVFTYRLNHLSVKGFGLSKNFDLKKLLKKNQIEENEVDENEVDENEIKENGIELDRLIDEKQKENPEEHLGEGLENIPDVRLEESFEGNLEENSEDGSEDGSEENEDVLQADKVKNANVWIDCFKEDVKKGFISERESAARILAVRILSDSVRGNLSTLKKPIKGKDIIKVADELGSNDVFATFINSIETEEVGNLLKKRGHGGVFEDKFKEYILNLPAGDLENDKILDRFMPRVIDRIDVLKKQVKNKEPGEAWNYQIAETIILRGLIGAQRDNKKLLYAKIPTNTNLAGEACSLATSEHFCNICDTQKVKSDFLEGHGGLMIENLSKAQTDTDEKEALKEAGIYFTASHRYNELKYRAMDLAEELREEIQRDPKSEETKSCCEEVRELLAEVIAMSSLMNQKDHRNPVAAPVMKKLQGATVYVKNNPTFKRTLFPNNTLKEHLSAIEDFRKAEDPEQYANQKRLALQKAFLEAHPEVNRAGKEKKGTILAHPEEKDIQPRVQHQAHVSA